MSLRAADLLELVTSPSATVSPSRQASFAPMANSRQLLREPLPLITL